MSDEKFNIVAIFGVGLIGSSIAHALKKYYDVKKIMAIDENKQHLKIAKEIGFIDDILIEDEDIRQGLGEADLVVLATPIGSYKDIVSNFANNLKPSSVLMDTGSTKQSVVNELKYLVPGDVHFIPAHPVAGTEHSGPHAGFPSLFQNRHVILTPLLGTDSSYVEKIRAMWQQFGAYVEEMTPEHHDRVLAITSHLPHLIAYGIVQTASRLEESMHKEQQTIQDSANPTPDNHHDTIIRKPEVIRYSAGGFRDFTRIAASDPVMWRDVFLNNREAVLEMLGRFQEDLFSLQHLVRHGDGEALFNWFENTRDIRRSIIDERQAGQYIAEETSSQKK